MNDKSKYIPALRFHWLTPIYDPLLKFNVTGVNGRPVVNAKLRLYSEGSSNKGGDFHRVADQTWQEGTLTWNNAPAADPQILKLGAVSPTLWGEPEHLVRSGHHLADHGRRHVQPEDHGCFNGWGGLLLERGRICAVRGHCRAGRGDERRAEQGEAESRAGEEDGHEAGPGGVGAGPRGRAERLSL